MHGKKPCDSDSPPRLTCRSNPLLVFGQLGAESGSFFSILAIFAKIRCRTIVPASGPLPANLCDSSEDTNPNGNLLRSCHFTSSYLIDAELIARDPTLIAPGIHRSGSSYRNDPSHVDAGSETICWHEPKDQSQHLDTTNSEGGCLAIAEVYRRTNSNSYQRYALNDAHRSINKQAGHRRNGHHQDADHQTGKIRNACFRAKSIADGNHQAQYLDQKSDRGQRTVLAIKHRHPIGNCGKANGNGGINGSGWPGLFGALCQSVA